MRIKNLHCIAKNTRHNAFTDLCQFAGSLYCCFREATDHVSPDGQIVILQLTERAKVIQRQRLHLPACDLRDPKLSITPDGQLLLLAYARHINQAGHTRYAQTICWQSQNGQSWSSPRYFCAPNWWLWRIRWHKNQAYGFAYKRSEDAIDLYKGEPRSSFYLHKVHALSLQRHGLGYPNESDLLFTQNDKAYALVRRDADSFSAQLGISSSPYTRWQWHDLGQYIGGPIMLTKNTSQVWVAGRRYHNGKLQTALWLLDLSSKQLHLQLLLPSGGDNSYPGLIKQEKHLWMSYYSSHQSGQAAIYLAKIAIDD